MSARFLVLLLALIGILTLVVTWAAKQQGPIPRLLLPPAALQSEAATDAQQRLEDVTQSLQAYPCLHSAYASIRSDGISAQEYRDVFLPAKREAIWAMMLAAMEADYQKYDRKMADVADEWGRQRLRADDAFHHGIERGISGGYAEERWVKELGAPAEELSPVGVLSLEMQDEARYHPELRPTLARIYGDRRLERQEVADFYAAKGALECARPQGAPAGCEAKE